MSRSTFRMSLVKLTVSFFAICLPFFATNAIASSRSCEGLFADGIGSNIAVGSFVQLESPPHTGSFPTAAGVVTNLSKNSRGGDQIELNGIIIQAANVSKTTKFLPGDVVQVVSVGFRGDFETRAGLFTRLSKNSLGGDQIELGGVIIQANRVARVIKFSVGEAVEIVSVGFGTPLEFETHRGVFTRLSKNSLGEDQIELGDIVIMANRVARISMLNQFR